MLLIAEHIRKMQRGTEKRKGWVCTVCLPFLFYFTNFPSSCCQHIPSSHQLSMKDTPFIMHSLCLTHSMASVTHQMAPFPPLWLAHPHPPTESEKHTHRGIVSVFCSHLHLSYNQNTKNMTQVTFFMSGIPLSLLSLFTCLQIFD